MTTMMMMTMGLVWPASKRDWALPPLLPSRQRQVGRGEVDKVDQVILGGMGGKMVVWMDWCLLCEMSCYQGVPRLSPSACSPSPPPLPPHPHPWTALPLTLSPVHSPVHPDQGGPALRPHPAQRSLCGASLAPGGHGQLLVARVSRAHWRHSCCVPAGRANDGHSSSSSHNIKRKYSEAESCIVHLQRTSPTISSLSENTKVAKKKIRCIQKYIDTVV